MQRVHGICCLILSGLLVLPGCRIIKGFDVEDTSGDPDATMTVDMDAADMGGGGDAAMAPPDMLPQDDMKTPDCLLEEAICDGVDDDCDGQIDEGCDDDGDGYCDAAMEHAQGAGCQPGDCEDELPDINPGAAEPCLAEQDFDCDGETKRYRIDLSPIQPIIAEGALGEVEFVNMKPGPERSFGLFWTEQREFNPVLRFQKINELGTTEGEVIPLTLPDENVQVHEALWHEASQNWVVLWRSFAENGQGSIYRLNHYDRDGNPLGERKVVHETEAFTGFLVFLSNAHLVDAGDDVLLVYSASEGGVFDVYAALYDPTTHELHPSTRLYGDKFTYQLSWAYLEPQPPSQRGSVLFKEVAGFSDPPALVNEARFLELGLEEELDPQRFSRFFGEGYAHERLIKLKSNKLALISFAPRSDTTDNGVDYRLYIQGLDDSYNLVGGPEGRTELSPHAQNIQDTFDFGDTNIGLLYSTVETLQSRERKLAVLDRDTLAVVSNELFSPIALKDHSQQFLHYREGDEVASGRYYALYRKTGDLAENELRNKLVLYNEQGVELTRTGLFPNIDTRSPFFIPNYNDLRVLEDGTLEWASIDASRNPLTNAFERRLSRSALLPDGSTRGPEVFDPPIEQNSCSVKLVGDELICVTVDRQTTTENNIPTDCQAALVVYLLDENGQSVTSTSTPVPAVLDTTGDRPRCFFAGVNTNLIRHRADGSWVFLVHAPDTFDVNGDRVAGDLFLYNVHSRSNTDSKVLLEGGRNYTINIIDMGDEVLLLARSGIDGIRLGYAHFHPENPGSDPIELIPLTTPEPTAEQIANQDGYTISPAYLTPDMQASKDDFVLAYGVQSGSTFELFAQALPARSGPMQPAPAPISLGSIPTAPGEEGSPFFFSYRRGVLMVAASLLDYNNESARVVVAGLDTSTNTPITTAEIKDSRETFQQYPTAWVHPTRSHSLVFASDLSNQRVFVLSDEGELLQEISLPLTSLTSQNGLSTPPQGFAVYELPDGTIRWPLWSGYSNVAGRSMTLDLVCE